MDDPSNEVKVDTQPSQGDLFLKVTTKIFECGRLVHVTGCAPGVVVDIISDHFGGSIGWAYAPDYEVDVSTLPLVAGDHIHASAKLCADNFDSRDEDVSSLSHDLVPPRVADPVEDCGGEVRVLEVVPGARVDVYVNGRFAGSARAALTEANVPLDRPLVDLDSVYARQSLCGRTTERGVAVTFHEALDADFVPWAGGHLSERVCQLTGQHDPEPGHAHLNDTTQWGVFGTDLGINFQHGGMHYIFFGDEGIDVSPPDLRDADPIFYTTDLSAEPSGFHMHVLGQPGTNKFRRLAVNGFEIGDLGNFEVPTGGFSYNGKIHLFIALRDGAPMRRSFLASGADPHNPLDVLFQVDSDPIGGVDDPNATNPNPSRFINISPTVIRNEDWPDLPAQAKPGDGLLLFGSGWYRRSGVFLAWAPLTPGSDLPPPSAWHFFDPVAGKWSDPGHIGDAKPLPGPGNVGELSVTWVPALRRWVMLSEQGIVRGHIARRPTGPWLPLPQEVFKSDRDGALSKYVHVPGQDSLDDREAFKNQQGGAYGPFLVPRFTKWDPWTRTATLYYLMSTHVPYQIMLMKFRLRCG